MFNRAPRSHPQLPPCCATHTEGICWGGCNSCCCRFGIEASLDAHAELCGRVVVLARGARRESRVVDDCDLGIVIAVAVPIAISSGLVPIVVPAACRCVPIPCRNTTCMSAPSRAASCSLPLGLLPLKLITIPRWCAEFQAFLE